MSADPLPSMSRIDTTIPHPARRYDYLLGGTTNFPADRESGDRMIAAFPAARTTVVENRRFMRRAVAELARSGIRQFLDVGSGIPTSPNTHEVAQGIAPESRVVYVDNDPIVLMHAKELLTGSEEGATAYLEADLHRPGDILEHPDLRRTLDLSQPVALMLVAVLHFFPDAQRPYDLVGSLVRALAPGSCLVMSHATADFVPPHTAARLDQIVRDEPFQVRTRVQFAAFFDGLELIDPGIRGVSEWRSENEPPPRPPAEAIGCYGAVARIP
ncbi:SAM-dependent methyltransferase [Rugosimonospora acidiphila]|uniref:SAM-dependent methyltransferase n=1 Tax=Rugosimonospora acidiphila TaxID=556531 RepID=A0ABP9SDU6_9ACTN